MMEVLAWFENLGLSVWVRESPSLFAYTGLLATHAVGLALAVGVNVAIDLRVLGFAPHVPLGPLEKFFPVIWVGFWLNAISGGVLLMAGATHTFTNPVFLVKITLIGLAVWTLVRLRARVYGGAAARATSTPERTARTLAVTSIALWTAAIIAGKLIEYPYLFGMTAR